MGKLYDRLQKQLSTEFKKDAEDCLKIYEKLKEMNNGKVWESSWNPLTTVKFVGTYPNSEMINILFLYHDSYLYNGRSLPRMEQTRRVHNFQLHSFFGSSRWAGSNDILRG